MYFSPLYSSANLNRVLACPRHWSAYSASPSIWNQIALEARAAAVSPARSEPGPLVVMLNAGLTSSPVNIWNYIEYLALFSCLAMCIFSGLSHSAWSA